jgi:hypothetical protein
LPLNAPTASCCCCPVRLTLQEKKERRADNKLQGDEDDIDALLQKFALEEKQQKIVQVQQQSHVVQQHVLGID